MKSNNIEQLVNSKDNEASNKLVDFADVCPQVKVRRRSPTLLKLQWLAERIRKVEWIKAEVASGTYKIDSLKVAKSLLSFTGNADIDGAIDNEN